ncbi:MAG: hypothetical protein ACJ8EY_10450, partial [Sphingomicrobium sp.]
WTSALSTGALRPMERKRFATLVSAYDSVRFLEQTRELEDRAATILSPLGFPIQLTPDLRAHMLSAVYDVDRSRFTFALINPRDFADTMRQLGWNDQAEIDKWIKDAHKDMRDRGIKTRICVVPEKNPFVSRAGSPDTNER